MNYDILLERALAAFDPGLAVNSMRDYVQPTRQAILVKLHGSVNWGNPMRVLGSDWYEVVNRYDPLDQQLYPQLISATNPIEQIRLDSWPVYPVLTAPLAGKGEKDVVCPPDHLSALIQFFHGCHKFLFIGTSGFDTDLLDILSDNVREVMAVDHVGGGDVIETKERIHSGVRALATAMSRRSYQGFRDYVFSPAFDEWLRF
mgnify:CR=1 FL=1